MCNSIFKKKKQVLSRLPFTILLHFSVPLTAKLHKKQQQKTTAYTCHLSFSHSGECSLIRLPFPSLCWCWLSRSSTTSTVANLMFISQSYKLISHIWHSDPPSFLKYFVLLACRTHFSQFPSFQKGHSLSTLLVPPICKDRSTPGLSTQTSLPRWAISFIIQFWFLNEPTIYYVLINLYLQSWSLTLELQAHMTNSIQYLHLDV